MYGSLLLEGVTMTRQSPQVAAQNLMWCQIWSFFMILFGAGDLIFLIMGLTRHMIIEGIIACIYMTICTCLCWWVRLDYIPPKPTRPRVTV
jgi:hypothetical protein